MKARSSRRWRGRVASTRRALPCSSGPGGAGCATARWPSTRSRHPPRGGAQSRRRSGRAPARRPSRAARRRGSSRGAPIRPSCRTTPGRTRAFPDAPARACEGVRSTGSAASRLPTHAPVHHRDLQDDADVGPATRARLELLVVKRHEVVPHLALAEVLHERGGRLLVAGRQIDHALVSAHHEVGVGELLFSQHGRDGRARRPSLPSRSTRSRTPRSWQASSFQRPSSR